MGQPVDICQTTSSFSELIKLLFSFTKTKKSGLECMRLLDKAQGHLHLSFRSIHVAGTNGKGSVCHKIAKGLEAEGYKVGLYTSPHLFSFCERICINGQMISEALVEKLLPPIIALGVGSFFDYTTALAFAYFAQEKVDFAVIETGIGGRFDATNIITPVLSIITSISYDHTSLLGNTLQEIAYQKAGIIKNGIPYLLGPSTPFLEGPKVASEGTEFFYDQENSSIAKRALEMLNISKSSILQALSVRPPCRFEVIDDSFVLDVAHNPDAISRLIDALSFHFPQKKLHFMAGFCRDKDVASCLLKLSQVGEVTCVSGAYPRLMKVEELAELAQSLKIQISILPKVDVSAIHCDLLVICGSFYIMAEARQSIKDWALSLG